MHKEESVSATTHGERQQQTATANGDGKRRWAGFSRAHAAPPDSAPPNANSNGNGNDALGIVRGLVAAGANGKEWHIWRSGT